MGINENFIQSVHHRRHHNDPIYYRSEGFLALRISVVATRSSPSYRPWVRRPSSSAVLSCFFQGGKYMKITERCVRATWWMVKLLSLKLGSFRVSDSRHATFCFLLLLDLHTLCIVSRYTSEVWFLCAREIQQIVDQERRKRRWNAILILNYFYWSVSCLKIQCAHTFR